MLNNSPLINENDDSESKDKENAGQSVCNNELIKQIKENNIEIILINIGIDTTYGDTCFILYYSLVPQFA